MSLTRRANVPCACETWLTRVWYFPQHPNMSLSACVHKCADVKRRESGVPLANRGAHLLGGIAGNLLGQIWGAEQLVGRVGVRVYRSRPCRVRHLHAPPHFRRCLWKQQNNGSEHAYFAMINWLLKVWVHWRDQPLRVS